MSRMDKQFGQVRNRFIAAGRNLFKTKGFDKTTLQDLLVSLEVEECVFKEYFQSMDELLEVVWSEPLKIQGKEEKKSLLQQVSYFSPKDTKRAQCAM